MSQAELAQLAGFKGQSAIGNLENRATGRGGFSLTKIAAALSVPLEWLLDGPDEPPTVPFIEHGSMTRKVSEHAGPVHTDTDRAVAAIRRLPPKAIKEVLQFLDYLAVKYQAPSTHGADHSVSAPAGKKAA